MSFDPQIRRKLPLPEADAYIFDIDGTLVVTRDLVHWNALRTAMRAAYGVDTTIDGLAYHGKTDISILRSAVARVGIGSEEFERGLPRALAVICREVDDHCGDLAALVPEGIAPLLASLSRRKKLLGVASGNLESVGWHKLAAAGLRAFFAFGSFGDRQETRLEIFRHALRRVEQSIGPQACSCFLGDTPADIEAAHELGAKIVAVSTGTFSFEELRSCSPDLCVSDCREFFPD
jgi:beta-phosphoglucomutase-like phosphatase (HAD superfamily)